MQNLSNITEIVRKGLRRLFASLPLLSLLAMIGVIIVLQSWIASEGKSIQSQKAAAMAKAPEPINVVALEVRPAPLNDRISLPGVVRPWVALKVVAEVPGKIVAKKVAEGQNVEQGAVLALIDDRDYRNAHASATAAYQAAKAAHDRLARLFKEDLATRAQFDDAVALMNTSKAAMDNAALNQERCAIRSATAGVVDRMHVEVGQYLGSGDPVADVLRMDRVKIEVGIPESDVDAVRAIELFKLSVDALKGRTFEGRRHYLAKSADTLARTYRLEIEVANPEGTLLPDMFVRAEIVKQRIEDALSVPLFALISQQKGQAVYVAEAGKARLVPVQTGIQEGWQVQVREGLAAGAKVIVVGQRDTKDGGPVNLVRTIASAEELNQ
ncbi:MAG: efflux RND transporter periplasmic adaptor subunit [Desulfobacterales bacterium]|nr:efflux RND transporter periplasmic adaptor subunit [Desulfobacterales bacterium]